MSRGSRKSRWFDLALAAQLGWLLASAELARAQHVQTDAPPDYTEAMEAAQREFGAAKFGAAVTEFSRADRAWPSARSKLGLGRSEFELRNYVRAIEHLKSALRSQVQPLDERTRPLAEQLLKLAERSVGRFTIESNSSEVNVSVDGDPVTLRDRKLVLNPGSRLLEVGADDFESQRLQLLVKGGEDRKLSFALEPEAAWYANPWVWIGAGVLLAGATTMFVVFATTETEGGNVPTPGRVGP